MKICTKCKVEKNKSEFHKNSQSKDKLRPNCKVCELARRALYAARNPEKIRESSAKYWANNKDKISSANAIYREENKDSVRESKKAWRIDNIEKSKAQVGAWRRKNRERVRELNSAWNLANPEVMAAIQRNRRARIKSADGSHSGSDVNKIFAAQRGLCASCKIKLLKSGKQRYHVDHIMPLALGGSNWPTNLQCLCPACNLSKGAKHPDIWAAAKGRML